MNANKFMKEHSAALGILLLGIALRIYSIGRYDFWSDEARIYLTAAEPSKLLDGSYVAAHPVLFELLFYPWKLLGSDEATLRLYSVTWGVFTLIAFYMLVHSYFGRKVAIISLLLAAASPFHVHYSQELKSYIALPLFSIASYGFLFSFLEKRDKGSLAFLSIINAAALYTDYWAIFYIAAQNAALIFQFKRYKSEVIPWTVSQTATGLLFAPWLPIFFSKATTILVEATRWWIPKPGASEVAVLLKTFVIGYNGNLVLAYTALLTGLIAATLGAWRLYKTDSTKFTVVSFWFATSIVIAFLYSNLPGFNSIFIYRGFLTNIFPFLLLIAVGLASPIPNPYKLIIATFIAFLSIVGLNSHYKNNLSYWEFPFRPGVHFKKEFRKAADHIKRNFKKGDFVALSMDNTFFPLRFYGISKENMKIATYGATVTKALLGKFPDEKVFERFGSKPVEIKRLLENSNRLWFVFSTWDPYALEPLSTMQRYWLDGHAVEISKTEFKGISVILYEKSGLAAYTIKDSDDSSTLLYKNRTYKKDKLLATLYPLVDCIPPIETSLKNNSLFIKVGNGCSNAPLQLNVQGISASSFVETERMFRKDSDTESFIAGYLHNPSSKVVKKLGTQGGTFIQERGAAETEVYKEINIEPGRYDFLARMAFAAQSPNSDRSLMRITLDEKVIGQRWWNESQNEPGWRWVKIGTIELSKKRETLSVIAINAGNFEISYGDLDKIAILPATPSSIGEKEPWKKFIRNRSYSIPQGDSISIPLADIMPPAPDGKRLHTKFIIEEQENKRLYEVELPAN